MRLFAPSFKTQFNKTLDNLSLSNFEKDIICRRYLDIVAKMESDYMRVCILYVTLTSIVALSSVLVTMVSPFEKIVGMPPVLGTIIFWGGWGLSFILTVANKWLLFGNYGKKYVLNWVLLEKYRNEGWSFASGINKYKNCVDMSAKFRLFCARVERIKMKSMEIMPEIETNEVNEILSTGSQRRIDQLSIGNDIITGIDFPIHRERVIQLRQCQQCQEQQCQQELSEVLIDQPK